MPPAAVRRPSSTLRRPIAGDERPRAPVRPGSAAPAVDRLWFEDGGAGPAVVLLHGLADTHALWRHQLPGLRTRYRAIAVDHLGHGRTPLPPGRLTTRRMAGAVAGLIDHLGIAPAAVVGLSMGGGVAQTLALERPDLVRALVLVSTGSEFPPATRQRFLDRADLAEREGMAAVVDATVPRWFAPDFGARHPDELAFTYETVLANDPAAFAAASRANAERDWSDRLGEIRCPVLFVGGELDPAGPRRSAAIFAERMPDLRVELIPGVSHLVPVEVPDRFTELTLAFLDDLEPGRAGDGQADRPRHAGTTRRGTAPG